MAVAISKEQFLEKFNVAEDHPILNNQSARFIVYHMYDKIKENDNSISYVLNREIEDLVRTFNAKVGHFNGSANMWLKQACGCKTWDEVRAEKQQKQAYTDRDHYISNYPFMKQFYDAGWSSSKTAAKLVECYQTVIEGNADTIDWDNMPNGRGYWETLFRKIYHIDISKKSTQNPNQNKHDDDYGIYGIYFGSELVYIGMTERSFTQRWGEHLAAIMSGTDNSLYMYTQISAYDIHKLSFKVLINAKEVNEHTDRPGQVTRMTLKDWEYALIKMYQPRFNYMGVHKPYRWDEKN